MLKNVADIYPLTGMQQMMLVRALSDRQSSLFVEQLTATFDGRLDRVSAQTVLGPRSLRAALEVADPLA